jgi:hypothetical protein
MEGDNEDISNVMGGRGVHKLLTQDGRSNKRLPQKNNSQV